MINLLQFSDGNAFATSVSPFFIGESGQPAAGRLLMEVSIEGLRTLAAIDTGGYYFICHPDLADDLVPFLTDPLPMGEKGEARLEIRGRKIKGNLYSLTVELLDIQGDNLRVPATVFIPSLQPEEIWDLPSIIGYQGFLDHFRFGVDPEQTFFYFGPLGETY